MTCVFPPEDKVIQGVRYGELPPLTVDMTNPTVDTTGTTADATVFGTLPLIGNYVPAPESKVELNHQYGGQGTEFTGLLVAGGGGGPGAPVQPEAPVDGDGKLRSPLIIGREYTAAVGRDFNWRIVSKQDLTATNVRLVSRMAQRCNLPDAYDFDLTAKVTLVSPDVYEISVDYPDLDNSGLYPGWYRWWLVASDATGGKDVQLTSGMNLWQRG